jgi:two-component system response regulator NreC
LQIVLVDDHAILRHAIRGVLAGKYPDAHIAGEAATAREAVAIVEASSPDVVLMDIMLAGSSGIAATREIRRVRPASRVLVYTAMAEPGFAIDALSAGAAGYVLKTQSIDELLGALTDVVQGKRYVAPSIEQALAERGPAGASWPGALPTLSAREREIFDLVVAGYTNRRLSAELFISVKTVETHRSRINRKLGVHSTAQLVRYAALHRRVAT